MVALLGKLAEAADGASQGGMAREGYPALQALSGAHRRQLPGRVELPAAATNSQLLRIEAPGLGFWRKDGNVSGSA